MSVGNRPGPDVIIVASRNINGSGLGFERIRVNFLRSTGMGTLRVSRRKKIFVIENPNDKCFSLNVLLNYKFDRKLFFSGISGVRCNVYWRMFRSC